MSKRSLVQVWEPADYAYIHDLADEYPREVGESVLLAELVDREVLR